MSEEEQHLQKPQHTSDDDEEGNLYNLFVCEDYVEKVWTFDSYEQRLLCSNMSSTDHDLTGQIVWPASLILTWFICHERDRFVGTNVLELGAGCGLAGFFAAKFANRVVITDGNDIVMRLLERNREFLALGNASTVKLLWGRVRDLQQLYPTPESLPDIIIGADIILWPSQIQNLLITAHFILYSRMRAGLSPGQVYISYVVRATSTSDLLFKTASTLDIVLDIVPVESFLPGAVLEQYKSLEKRMFSLRLDEERTRLRAEEIEEMYIASEATVDSQLNSASMPC